MRRTIFWLLVCGYGVLCGWAFLLWDGTRITQIVVTGTQRLSQARVIHAAEVALNGRIVDKISRAQYVLVRPEAVAEAVRSVSGAVRNATVVKRFPATIEIAVEEWSQVYLWCTEKTDTCFLLEDDGRIGRAVDSSDAIVRDNTVVTIRDYGTQKVVAMDATPLTPRFLAQLFTAFADAGIPLVADTVTTPHRQAEEITVMTQDGWRLTVATTQPVATTVRAVTSVLRYGMSPQESKNLASVDARLVRKVFYRTKDGAGTQNRTDQKSATTQDTLQSSTQSVSVAESVQKNE